MRRLPAVVIGLLVVWLGLLQPSAVMASTTLPTWAYEYDSQCVTAQLDWTVTERGPPAMYDPHSHAAADRWFRGASARPAVGAAYASTDYDSPVRLVQIDGSGAGAQGQAEGDDRALTSSPRGPVAAKTRRVDDVDNLPCNCFVAGTEVHTADGEKPIEHVQVGDKVWARNLKTGKNELRRVTGLFQKRADQVMTITVSGGSTVTVTEEHPFYVADLGWVMSGDLKVGDALAQRDGRSTEITAITAQSTDVTVYNFTVEGDHNYYVTGAQLLVHNCPVAPGGRGYRPGGAAADFDLDELAQMIRGHAGADDLTRPSFSEIRTVLDRGTGSRLPGQNSYRLDYNGVRVIVNEDLPWRSTAYYPGQ